MGSMSDIPMTLAFGAAWGPGQLILILVIVLLLFGRGKISELMGDFAKGIKSFKKGLSDEDEPQKPHETATIEHKAPPPASETKISGETKV